MTAALVIIAVFVGYWIGRQRVKNDLLRRQMAWSLLRTEDDIRHRQWTAKFPAGAIVDLKTYTFCWRHKEGHMVDIDQYMASIGHPKPRKLAPRLASDMIMVNGMWVSPYETEILADRDDHRDAGRNSSAT